MHQKLDSLDKNFITFNKQSLQNLQKPKPKELSEFHISNSKSHPTLNSMHNLKSLRKTEENMHEKSILEKMDQNET